MKTSLFFKRLLLVWILAFSAGLWGQVNMTTTGSYTQDFNALISTGTGTWSENSTIGSWYAKRSGTGTGIAADAGTGTGGNLYSYGIAGNSDRALGSLGSSNAAAGNFAYGVLLRNNSQVPITSIKVTYTLEQWRNSAVAAQTVAFFYKISSSVISDLQPNNNSSWIAVTALNSAGPVSGGTAGALVGNNTSNKVTKTDISLPAVSLGAGEYVMLKWDDPDHTGSDHGLSIDDVMISWTVTPACASSVFSFNPATVNKTTADPAFTNTFTTDNTSPTAYLSSNTSVATVNSTTGEVTIVGAGSTTISVTQAADGTRCAVSANYTLNVASIVPNLVLSGTPLNHGSFCPGTAGTSVQYTITNTGTVAADGVTAVSSGTNASDFVISGLPSTTIAANGGTATFDVTFTPSASDARSATVTVSSTTPGSNSPTLALTGTGSATVAGAVSTSAESNLGSAAVRLNGNVATLGTCPATAEKGFVWGTNLNPTDADNLVPVTGLATGNYVYNLSGLTPNITYHYRAYIRDANNSYTYGDDEAFTTLDVADHIAFVNVPATGSVNTNLAAFTVEARTAGNLVDAAYTGNVTLSKASGSGVISGTLTKAFVNGVAAFNDIKFDAADTYTLHADSGSFTQITSGNVVVAKKNQTVTLNDLNAYVGASPVTLPATTNATLTLTYVSDTPAVASVSGNTLTIGNAGTATITATNAGNGEYNAFTDTFTVTVTVIPPVTHLVISQIYGAGGNSGASYNRDYVELFNPTNAPISLNGHTLQYAAATGSTWTNNTNNALPNVNIQPGRYFLIQLTTTGSNGSSLPAPDFAFPTGMDISGTNGKIALVSSTTTLSGANPSVASIVDLVGFGTASGYEFSAAPAPSSTNSIFRKSNGSQDTNDNGNDFVTGTPNPRNTAIAPTTSWNGSAWTYGAPDSTMPAVISSDYSGATFAASALTVNNASTLTITNGNSVTVGNVTNNGGIVVEDGGNFIQTAGGTYSGPGTFTANRNSTSAVNKYAFWSSPVSAANIYSVFPGFTPQYVMTYNTATDLYTTVANPTATAAGTGYSVKMPATAANLVFNGTPNNGDITKTLSVAGNKYNLVGNPYPSNVDMTLLLQANTANIESTFWFWDNKSNSVTTQSGNTTTNVGYATYNAGSSTWNPAPGDGSATPVVPADDAVKTGQGFIVEAKTTALDFTNSMRVSDTGASVNKTTTSGDGKYWLKLTTPYHSWMVQAITYGQGASNAYDAFDSKAIATGSDAFYSLAGAEKLIIQGRAAFDINDVVLLGNKHFENGQFTIALMQTEGLFANGQAVYLRDKLLGTETNLQNGAYTFAANAGDFTTRFEIVYKQTVLGTADAVKGELKVYRSGDDFMIESPSIIRTVEVYDATGRLVQTLKPNARKAAVNGLSRGVYVLQIKADSFTVTRKIIKQ